MASRAGGKGEPSDAIRARCIVEAELPGETDVTVGKRYGVSARSIQRWRSQLDDRPEFAATVAALRASEGERLDRQWSRPLKHAIVAIAGECVRIARKSKDPSALPGLLRSLNGLVQAVAHFEIMLSRGVGEPARPGTKDEPGAPLAAEWEKTE